MKYLAIDTSGKNLTLVLNIDGEIHSYFDSECGVNHSTQLMPKLEQILNGAKCNLSELDFIACVVGAGSFTGIRIGVATVKGLSFGTDTPVCAVSTLEAMAYSFFDREGAYVCPVLNARRGDVYNALFKIVDGKPQRLTQDASMHATDLESMLNDYENVFFCGDGVSVLKKFFTSRTINEQNELLAYPSGYGVALAGLNSYNKGLYTTGIELAPVYLKPSQAERERLERTEKSN